MAASPIFEILAGPDAGEPILFSLVFASVQALLSKGMPRTNLTGSYPLPIHWLML